MIGLCGAHRTGKTTLAKAFAEYAGIPFVQASASRVFFEMGLQPHVDYSLDVRLDVQEAILARHCEQWAKQDGEFITDRTPVDFMAYTLADVKQGDLTEALDARLQKYLRDCIAATNRFFSCLIVVQPGIGVVAEEGKASLAQSHIDHIAHLVMGIVVDEAIHTQHFYIPRRLTDIEKRLEAVSAALRRSAQRHERHLAEAEERGQPVIFH